MDDADQILADPGFQDLKANVISLTGLAYWGDKEPSLAAALAPLLAERGVAAAELAARVAAECGRGPETDALIEAVTVGETFFFRYPDQFAAFERDILPECLHRNRDRRTLSVWSAGCSNGAETYSLAMAIRRRQDLLDGWRVQILGTDISLRALVHARIGEYGDWAVRGMSPALLTECFSRVGNKWRVRDVYREGVEFRSHNLVTEPPPPSLAPGRTFDVVFCRNVLMYFDRPTRDRVLGSLRGGLAEDGWLVVAHAEAGLEITDHFQAVNADGTILYRRLPPPQFPERPQRPKVKPRAKRPSPPPRTAAPPYEAQATPREVQVIGLLNQGKFPMAADLAHEWVAARSLEPAAHYFLGLALEPLSPAQAVGAFRRAVYLSPNFSMALFHLSRLAEGHESERYRRALDESLSGPQDRELALGEGLTAGELTAVIRHSGSESVR